MRKLTLFVTVIALFATVAFAPATTKAQEGPKDIVDTAVADGRFTTLVAAVQAAGLVDALKGEGPFTVFAPTDDAFAAAFAALGITPEALLADTETLTNILLYHVVAGKVMAADVVGLQQATALNGDNINISVMDGKVYLNESAQVIITDIETSNGVIHVIDAVLLPPAKPSIVEIAAGNENFSTLVAAIEAAGLVDFFSRTAPITVFAPTNAAFEAAFAALGIAPEALLADTATLTNILLYHVAPGAWMSDMVMGAESIKTFNGQSIAVKMSDMGLSLNDGQAPVSAGDIMAGNGVIHVIDGVLLPPAEEMGMATGTIVDVAAGNESFSTLVAAVQAAGLVDALSAAGPYTVFAPTNDAFAAALAALGISAEALLADTATLTSILLYHVAPGKITADMVVMLDEIGTLNGATIKVKADEMGVSLNDGQAMVSAADVMASNGVVHVIDGVILPPAE